MVSTTVTRRLLMFQVLQWTDANLKTRLIAEARFLRGLHYF
jgi:hypothetical protein